MATIPSRKFAKTKQKIASRGFPKSQNKLTSRGFAKGTAKIASRKLSQAPAEKKPVAPAQRERPTVGQSREDRLAALRDQVAALKPASDL